MKHIQFWQLGPNNTNGAQCIHGQSCFFHKEIYVRIHSLKNFWDIYDSKCVFNVDKGGLLCKCLSEKILYLKEDRYFCENNGKERIIVMDEANMRGMEKPHLLVLW